MGIKLSVDQPTLEEMLADPIVTLVMSSDKVTEAEIRGILRKVAAHRWATARLLKDRAVA